MIRPQHFIGLAASTAAAVLLATGLYVRSNTWSAGKLEGRPFLPELAQGINSVGSIAITQGGETLTLVRNGQSWSLKERAGFPVKPDAARTLLVALAQSQLIEPRTSVKDKLSLLELEEPAAKEAKSRRVRIFDPAGKAMADVVLGKSRFNAFGSDKGGTYVRRMAETQTWLATGEPRATADIRDWVDTKLLAHETAKITRVTIESPGDAPLVIERAPPEAKAEKEASGPPRPPVKESKYRLAAIPDGKKLRENAGIDSIVDAFSSIDLDDVRKLDQPPGGDSVQVIKVESEVGTPSLTLRLRRDGDSRWLSLSAAGEGDAKKKADEINAKAQGWEFRIATWKADQIGKRAADLLEGKES